MLRVMKIVIKDFSLTRDHTFSSNFCLPYSVTHCGGGVQVSQVNNFYIAVASAEFEVKDVCEHLVYYYNNICTKSWTSW